MPRRNFTRNPEMHWKRAIEWWHEVRRVNGDSEYSSGESMAYFEPTKEDPAYKYGDLVGLLRRWSASHT